RCEVAPAMRPVEAGAAAGYRGRALLSVILTDGRLSTIVVVDHLPSHAQTIRRQSRASPGDTRHARSQNAPLRAGTRARDREVHPADHARRAVGGTRIALPRTPSAGAQRLDRRALGDAAGRCARAQVLPPDHKGASAVACAGIEVGCARWSDRARHASGAGTLTMWRGLRSDAHRPTSDEIARELRDHLELEAQEIGARGVDATTAAALAHRRFGNVTLALENVRAEWRVGWIDQLSRDVRHGLRGLRRSPVYTITAATTLALGIGASVAVFSLGYHVLERPFPLFPQDRLVWIVQRSPRQCPTCDKASPGAYEALREHTASLSAVGAAQLWRATLRGSGEEPSNLVHGYLVTANLFRLVAAPFALGRDFPTDADRAGRSGVAVLTYDFWQRRFHGSRGVLDSTIMLDGNPRRVVGVLARHVVFPTESQFYLPLVLTAADANEHASRYLDIFARLAPGATVAGAQREAAVLSARLATEYPRPNADWQLVPLPLRSFHTDGVALLVRIFAVAAALVLLAACVSVANLALARTSARRREVALRAALGGQRGRLVRTLLVEALLVAFVGGLIGVGLAAWGIHAAANIVPAELARYSPGMALTHVDGRALAFTVVMCVITAVMFAALPALRVTSAPLSSVLTDGGRSSAGDAHGARLRAALVVVEVSVALALLSAAVLLTRSVRNMMRGDPGVRLDHVLTTQLSLPRGTSDSAARVFITRLDERLRQERGIIQAGVVSTTPLSNNW